MDATETKPVTTVDGVITSLRVKANRCLVRAERYEMQATASRDRLDGTKYSKAAEQRRQAALPLAITSALTRVRVIETDRVDTAATDGIVILVNPAFFATLSHDEAVGLLMHEIMHIRLDHPRRFSASVYSNHQAANMAMDDEINPLLEGSGFILPSGGCHPGQHQPTPSDPGRSWESYYATRLAMLEGDGEPDPARQEPGGVGGGGGGGGDESGGGGGGDESGGGIAEGCHTAGDLANEFAPEAIENASAREVVGEMREAMRDAMQALANGEHRLKKIVSHCEEGHAGSGRGVGSWSSELNPPEPVLLKATHGQRWQQVVIDTVRKGGDTVTSWSRRSRRQVDPAIMPGKRRVNGLAIAMVLDVSGSCTKWFDLWESLANELVDSVHQVVRIDLIYHNDRVILEDRWSRSDGTVELARKGGGGTSHVDAIDAALRAYPDVIVQFTDNDTDWGNVFPDVACVTVMPPGCRDLCPYGVNIHAEV